MAQISLKKRRRVSTALTILNLFIFLWMQVYLNISNGNIDTIKTVYYQHIIVYVVVTESCLLLLKRWEDAQFFLYYTSEYVASVIFVTLLLSFCSFIIIFSVFPLATITAGQEWSVAMTIVSLHLQELFLKWRHWFRRLQAYQLLHAVKEYSFQSRKMMWEFYLILNGYSKLSLFWIWI